MSDENVNNSSKRTIKRFKRSLKIMFTILADFCIKENTYINIISTLKLLRKQRVFVVYSYKCSK